MLKYFVPMTLNFCINKIEIVFKDIKKVAFENMPLFSSLSLSQVKLAKFLQDNILLCMF